MYLVADISTDESSSKWGIQLLKAKKYVNTKMFYKSEKRESTVWSFWHQLNLYVNVQEEDNQLVYLVNKLNLHFRVSFIQQINILQ